MAIEEVIESLQKPGNKNVADDLFRLMVLNHMSIYPFEDKAFLMIDKYNPGNNGVYWVEHGVLLCCDPDDEEAYKITIHLPECWKETIMKDHIYRDWDFVS